MNRKSFDIQETKRFIIARDGGRCKYCDPPGPGWQCAHILKQTKLHRERYGDDVIYHPSNMVLTCDVHNCKAAVDYRTRPIQANAIAAEIRERIEKEN